MVVHDLHQQCTTVHPLHNGARPSYTTNIPWCMSRVHTLLFYVTMFLPCQCARGPFLLLLLRIWVSDFCQIVPAVCQKVVPATFRSRSSHLFIYVQRKKISVTFFGTGLHKKRTCVVCRYASYIFLSACTGTNIPSCTHCTMGPGLIQQFWLRAHHAFAVRQAFRQRTAHTHTQITATV